MEENPTDMEGADGAVGRVQPEEKVSRRKRRIRREDREEPCEGLQQCREAQWQDFLSGLDSPQAGWGKESGPWEDTKAFLASFEQVAQACQWPREEWVARLLPALSGEVQKAFCSLKARDREDYGKVKAAILHWEANCTETLRQHFRQFRFREVEDPRQIYSQLQELCHRWLRPERHSKEQILELLIMEQFLAILPPELHSQIGMSSPEHCTQAAALEEDFLPSHQGAEAEKWQRPLQEAYLDAEAHALQGQTYNETKQSDEREIGLLGRENKGSHLSCSSHLPEGQKTDRIGPIETDFRETDVSLPMVKRTLIQPGQRTMFWQVLQEDERNVNSLEGLLVPKRNLSLYSGKGENFVQIPEERERLPDRDSGDGRQRWIKRENDIAVQIGLEEIEGTLGGNSQWSFSGLSEIYAQKRESRGLQQEMKPEEGENERNKSSEDLASTSGEVYADNAEEKTHLFSKYGRKYRYTPAFVTVHAREDISECPIIGEDTQQQCKPGPHPRIQANEKRCELPEGKKAGNAIGGWSNHQGEKTYECPKCGKSFSCGKSLKNHQVVHTAGRPFECSQCGKSYRQRKMLLKHQKIHTGEKLQECLVCGKIFATKAALMRHQRIHTDEKLFQGPQCDKSFRHQQTLKEYQTLHIRESPQDCPLFGESFSSRVHTEERPYECPQCEKCFKRKIHLIRHQRIHTGEKPFQCAQCRKAFRQREHLRRHQLIHTGEKPFECPECGKNFSRKNKLISHQGTHKGQWLYQCPECGKSFSQKATLSKHCSSHVGC